MFVYPQGPVSGYVDVLAREETWYTANLADRGVAGLLAASGGPFAVVAANPRRLSQGRNQLWLAHAETSQGRGTKQDTRWDHDIVALLLWSATQASVRAQDDEVALDAAANLVADRVRGPAGDRSHDGRWWSVGPVRIAPPTPTQFLVWTDIIGGLGAAYLVTVSYRCSEWTPA